MSEPIDPKLLAEIRHRLPHWEEMGKSGLTDSIRALLAEVDRQAVMLTNQEHAILNEYGQVADAHAEIDRLRADLEAAEETIKAQKADMGTWAVRWQEQFDRAEEAEQEVETRGETIDRLRAELNATTVTAEEGLEVNGELLAENVHLRKHGCPHIVTDGATSHCSLSERQVREVERQRDGLIEAARALAEDVGSYGPESLVGRLVEQCDKAEGAS